MFLFFHHNFLACLDALVLFSPSFASLSFLLLWDLLGQSLLYATH